MGVWRNGLARLSDTQKVSGSTPLTPTNNDYERKETRTMRKFKYDFSKMRPRADLGQIYLTAGIDFEQLGVKNVQQVFAHEATIEKMERVLRRGVRRKYPFMVDRKVNSSVGFAMLGYAPVTDNSIPVDEIWVYDEEEGARALEALREKNRLARASAE